MLWQILLWGLFGVILFILTKEFIGWYRLKSFAKQGFATHYYPIAGNVQPILEGMKTKNGYSHYVKLANESKGKPGIAMNNAYSFRSNVTLFDIDVVREFLNVEHLYCLRVPFFDLKANQGFVMEAGDRAFLQRTVLGTMFHRDNLNRIAPEIYTTVQKRFESAKITNRDPQGSEAGTFKDSHHLLEALMGDFTQNLVYPANIKVPKCKSGLTPAEEMAAISELAMGPNGGSHLLNFLFLGIPHEWNLLSGSREASQRGKDLQTLFEDCISGRQKFLENKSQGELGETPFNIIDSMIFHNKKAAASGALKDVLTLKELVGNCNSFTFASFDTTLTATTGVLFFLGQNPEIQSELAQEIQKSSISTGIKNIDTIDDCSMLNEFVAESLRIYSPAVMTFDRLVLKDFKIGKLEFFKGDYINAGIGQNLWDPSYFASGRTFAMNNRNSSNKKCFIPFSTGRRACIGQLLAELELKQILLYVLPRYKVLPLSKPEDVKYSLNIAMKLDNCFVKLVPRN